MYVLQGSELIVSQATPLKDLISGKWYAYAQRQGYSDYVLARKNEQNELTLIHAWVKESPELGFNSLTVKEVSTEAAIPVVTLRSGLEKLSPDYASQKWENLSVPEIYEDLYLEMYECDMRQEFVSSLDDYYDYQLVETSKVKELWFADSDIQQLEENE